MEDVVKQKLNEFQQQLDSVESALKEESRQRERTIAERAIKQMELISQKYYLVQTYLIKHLYFLLIFKY